jgi:hypothetical protein
MLEGLVTWWICCGCDHALQRLRFNQYHVILLDDDFEEMPNPSQVPRGLNMNIRREMFVVLSGSVLVADLTSLYGSVTFSSIPMIYHSW